jgi:hypothetical protein
MDFIDQGILHHENQSHKDKRARELFRHQLSYFISMIQPRLIPIITESIITNARSGLDVELTVEQVSSLLNT